MRITDWTSFETDGRTLKMVITTLKRRFKKLDKENSDIETIVRIADSLAKSIKAKHDLVKTYDFDVRLKRVEEAAALTKKYKMLN